MCTGFYQFISDLPKVGYFHWVLSSLYQKKWSHDITKTLLKFALNTIILIIFWTDYNLWPYEHQTCVPHRWYYPILALLLRPFDKLAPKTFFLFIWLSNLWTLFFYPLFNLFCITSFVLNNWIWTCNLYINDANAQIWKMSKRTQWFLRDIVIVCC